MLRVDACVLIRDVARLELAACGRRGLREDRGREPAGRPVAVGRGEVASRRGLVRADELVSLVVAKLELLRARSETVGQRVRIVIAEVAELLTGHLDRAGALLDQLAGDAAQLVVGPVRLHERHRARRVRPAGGDEARDVAGLGSHAQRCHPVAATLARIDPPLLVGTDPLGDLGSRGELRAQ